MEARIEADADQRNVGWRRVFVASAFLVALFAMAVPPLVLLVLRLLVCDHDQYVICMLDMPIFVCVYPACVGAFVLVATVVDLLRQRGLKGALAWLVAMALLGPFALVWYWICERQQARNNLRVITSGQNGNFSG